MYETNYLWNFCRTCIKQFSRPEQKNNDKQFITDIPAGSQCNTCIMELLEIIQPQIKAKIKDNLPTLVCSDCIKKLLLTHEFIEMYQNADKKLRAMLETVDMSKCNNNSDSQQKEIRHLDDFKNFKYQIEEINIDALEKEGNKVNNECQSEFDFESLQNISEDTKSNNSGDSDEWLPKKSWLNYSPDKLNSNDDSSKRKKKAKEFHQLKENGNVSCQNCVAVLDTVELLQEHVQLKHAKKRSKRIKISRKREPPNKTGEKSSNQKMVFECKKCSKKYSKYAFYKIHMSRHTADPYLCIECGRSFQIKRSFNIHMLRHKGEKNYQCPHCPMTFVCSNGLNNHLKVHINEKPHVCNVCGAAFHMPHQLRHHNLYHAGIKNFQCEYCDMRFVTREKQQRHMRTHTGEKPYKCKYCERAYSQSNECIKHLRTHLGDNVYQCELCPLRFPFHRDLRAHFASHKNDDEETRALNLQARREEEKNLQIKLGSKRIV